MNIKVPAAITAKFGRQLLVAEKNSPAILFGAGVVGMVATTVLACRATLQVDDILEKAQDDFRKMEEAKSITNSRGEVLYTENSEKRDKALVYVRTSVDIARLYAPAIVIGIASITMLTKSHNTLTRRNAALTAAYTALDNGFKNYRARIQKELGEDKERELYYDLEMCEIDVEDDNGKVKTIKTKRVGPNGLSIYAKFFDRNSTSWNPNPEYNVVFLRAQQSYANHLLQSRGHVMLNDVYDSLGLERTPAGAVVGWAKDNTKGDGYISFGIFDDETSLEVLDFMTGREGGVWLDFNVDGVVYDKI